MLLLSFPPYSTVSTKHPALKQTALVGVHRSQWMACSAAQPFRKCLTFFFQWLQDVLWLREGGSWHSSEPPPITEHFAFIENNTRCFQNGQAAKQATHCDLGTRAGFVNFRGGYLMLTVRGNGSKYHITLWQPHIAHASLVFFLFFTMPKSHS